MVHQLENTWIKKHGRPKPVMQIAHIQLKDGFNQRALRMSSAPETVNSPPDSIFAALTLRSSTKREKRLDRTPSPFSVRSSSRPRACVYAAEPSARNLTCLFSG